MTIASTLSAREKSRLLQLAMPRVVPEYLPHTPHPKQQLYLCLQQKEVLYGGSAGGGKSDALLMAAMQYVDVPGYSALILRRTWPDLNAPGAILDRARTWLSGTSAREREGGRMWRFPSGAVLTFGYAQHVKDKLKFQSAEYQFIGFDELTQFEEEIYSYLFSRLRKPTIPCLTCQQPVRRDKGTSWRHARRDSTCPNVYPDPMSLRQYTRAVDGTDVFSIPLRMRSATNPGGPGHEWVHTKFINPKTRTKDSVFLPASLVDNPSLDRESYEDSLSHLLPVDRQRLMDGDWDAQEAGEWFERHWFGIVREAPGGGVTVRYWDHAATAGGGDWTVGVLLRLVDGIWYVLDVVRGQWGTGEKHQVMAATAHRDGRGVRIISEQEPGSSGVDVIDNLRRNVFVGYPFVGDKTTGGKQLRAVPLVTAAGAGNLKLVEAQWNRAFVDEFVLFPNGANDDQVDATSGAMRFITQRRSRIIA